MLLLNYGTGFKDELVATALVLGITVSGSFFLLNQFVKAGGGNVKTQVLGTFSDGEVVFESKEQGNSENGTDFQPAISTPTPSPSSSASPSAQPTPIATVVEIPYGPSQDFNNDNYKISFVDPTLFVGNSRKFIVKAILANKKVANDGLQNALLATITRNGEVVASDVPMTLSESKRVHIGEQLTYFASLSMIEGTEITKIEYRPPDGIVTSIYLLSPP